MRASRLLTILITLQLRGRVSARALADELEVSKRTIYRDVDELSAAGVPIYAERGPNGGFALLDGFRTRLTGLTGPETDALLLAGLPVAAADLGLGRAAADVRLKLLASLPEPARTGAERVAERFHLDPVDWYRSASAPRQLRTIAEALWTDRRLEISYESWSRRSVSSVDPLGLVLKGGRWYLLARAGSKERIYRLDKVEAARVLDETAERSPDFDLAATWKASVAAFEASLERGRATLKARASSLDRVERLGAAMAEPLLSATPDPDGCRTAQVPIEGIGHAAGLLLGFGDEIEVIEPAELRQELGRRAARVATLYAANASR